MNRKRKEAKVQNKLESFKIGNEMQWKEKQGNLANRAFDHSGNFSFPP